MYAILLILAALLGGSLFFSMGFYQWGRWTVRRPFLWGAVIFITLMAITALSGAWEYVFGNLAWAALTVLLVVAYQVGSYLLGKGDKNSE